MSQERTFEVKEIIAGQYEEEKLICEVIGKTDRSVDTGIYTFNEAKQIRDGLDMILMKYDGEGNRI